MEFGGCSISLIHIDDFHDTATLIAEKLSYHSCQSYIKIEEIQKQKRNGGLRNVNVEEDTLPYTTLRSILHLREVASDFILRLSRIFSHQCHRSRRAIEFLQSIDAIQREIMRSKTWKGKVRIDEQSSKGGVCIEHGYESIEGRARCQPIARQHSHQTYYLAAFMMMAAGGWYIYTGGVVPHDVLPEDVAPQWYKWEGQDDNLSAVLHC
eukprot:scaffold3121_cov211-Skeletonema_marinoi.AAC.11